MIGDADRTIVGLLWHENVVDVLEAGIQARITRVCRDFTLPLSWRFHRQEYVSKQVWQFNEMSSIIKTMKSHHNYHNALRAIRNVEGPSVVETLAKYSLPVC